MRVIPFNAWQYAETNLWASLVDQVIRKSNEERLAPDPPEVTEANRLAEQADRQRRPQLAGGDQGGQREGVAVGVQQVLAGPVV